MKAIFQWSPLKPPTEGRSAEVAVANGVALAGGLLGFVMVGLGLDAGLTLYLPMLLSAFLFGLPHGAIDHLVLLGLANQRMTFKSLMVTCLAYLAVVGLVLLLWWALPMLALILFWASRFITGGGRILLMKAASIRIVRNPPPNGFAGTMHCCAVFFQLVFPFSVFRRQPERS